METSGMHRGAIRRQFSGFPAAAVPEPDGSKEDIDAMVDRNGKVFIKPVFKGDISERDEAGLIG